MTNDWPEGQQPREESFATLAAALAKAQAEMSNPTFDSQNPHFRSKFASLASVRNAVVPVLAKHGIAVTQDILATESGISCTTVLSHGSGQRMVFGPLVLPAAQTTAQGFGSAATYARRYQLMAVAAVAGDDDDDAEAAVGRDTQPDRTKMQAKAREYGKRMTDALEVGIDQPVIDIHHEMTEAGEEFYREAWAYIPTGARREIKAIIERSKAAA